MSALYKHLATQGFIKHYMEYMDGQETPYSFDFWCAVWLVSSVLRRRCYINRPGSPVWPNSYVLLVAPPAVARKGVAIGKATELMQWYMSIHASTETVYTGSLTPSMLLSEMSILSKMHGSAGIVIALPELSRSFARNAAKSTISFLTDMFDTKETETGGTKRDGIYTIKKASINLLAASTPDWLGGFGDRDAVAGGFASRCIYVSEDKPKRRVKWGEAGAISSQDVVRLDVMGIDGRLKDLEEYYKGAEIPIQVTKGAVDYYEDWRDRQEADARMANDGVQARQTRHVLATACILACADLTFEIQQNHIIAAIKAIEEVYPKPERVVHHPQPSEDRQAGQSINATAEDKEAYRSRIFSKLVEILREAGKIGIRQTEVTIKMRYSCDGDVVRTMLRMLSDYRCAQMFKLSGEKIGRPPIVWRATYLIDTPALEHARKLFVGEPMTAEEMELGLAETRLPNVVH